jgi:hypothetical protein
MSFIKSFHINKSLSCFLYLIATLFLIFVFSPIYVYWLNSGSILWQGYAWVSLFLIVSLCAFLISAFFLKANDNLIRFFKIAILSVYLYICIRVIFFPVSFGTLDGMQTGDVPFFSDWSILFSIILLIFIVICSCIFFKQITNIVQISFFVCVIAAIYLFFSIPTNEKPYAVDDNEPIQNKLLPFTNFSRIFNIIVISFDGIQNNLLQEVILKNKDFLVNFDGFTMYTDVLSYAPNTSFSLLSTLSSKYIETGQHGSNYSDLLDKYSSASFLNILSKNKYNVDTLNVPCKLTDGKNCFSSSDFIPKSYISQYKITAYDIVLLKIFPRSISWRLLDFFANQKRKDNKSELDLIMQDKAGLGFGIDKYNFRKLYEKMNFIEQPVLKFHHYLFTHQPLRYNENCRYDINTVQNIQSSLLEIQCALQEFSRFLFQLKKANIYDSSLIVLTSDHGYEANLQFGNSGHQADQGSVVNQGGIWPAGRYWPILLVKLPEMTGNLKINSNPVSLVDIVPTIYQVIDFPYCKNYSCDGISLLENNKLSHSRERKIMLFVGGEKHLDEKHDNSRLFNSVTIFGNSLDGVVNAMTKISLNNKEISCNTPIDFSQPSIEYMSQGLSDVESHGKWSMAKDVKVEFLMPKMGCNKNSITLLLNGFVTEKHVKQYAEVFLNSEKIGVVTIVFGETLPKQFTYNVPSNLFKFGEINRMEFRITNSISPKSLGISDDPRELAIAFKSMQIS